MSRRNNFPHPEIRATTYLTHPRHAEQDGSRSFIPFRELAGSLRRSSRIFCVLTAYLDESYNNRTFCVGGWLASVSEWSTIEKQWVQRVEYERRKSIEKGFPPISRYHASDCSSLKGEFDVSKGWDVPRQIKFSKKLLAILAKNKPIGIVVGGAVDDYLRHFTSDAKAKQWQSGLYYFSIMVVMDQIAQIVQAYFPREKVTIYYDRGKFSSMADRAFRSLKDDTRNADVSRFFVTMGPMGWEDCAPLQVADLLAFEGLKRVDGSLNGNDSIRRSLQALLGAKVDLSVGYFSDKTFQALIEEKKKELEALMDDDGLGA